MTLIKTSIFRKSVLQGMPRAACVSLFILSALFLFVASAHGMRLTNVEHLFDITHDFSQPSDVAVSKEGIIYIVDGVNNKIKVFNRSGSFMFSFGKKGSAKGEFMFPLGIDVDEKGRVYVADSGNHRIQVFTGTGGYIRQVAVPAVNGHQSDPTDVAVSTSADRLFVADNDNHYILSFELSSLNPVTSFGTPGAEEREFRYPFLMALDRDDYLYITDVVNTRVQVFNSDGLFVHVIGGWGVEKGRFFRPKGIAADTDNLIYVSDSYMGVIQVFRASGEFYAAVGEKSNLKKFIKPMGIYIDDDNRLYVVEMFAERVGVYRIVK